jgi:hypothetical protein
MNKRRPSITSLVAFDLIAVPIAYVLSYAPVVRICADAREFEPDRPRMGARVITADIQEPLADASRYPPYAPVDWLIDNTPLREPLFLWAEVWGVGKAFEYGYWVRNPLPPFGTV